MRHALTQPAHAGAIVSRDVVSRASRLIIGGVVSRAALIRAVVSRDVVSRAVVSRAIVSGAVVSRAVVSRAVVGVGSTALVT